MCISSAQRRSRVGGTPIFIVLTRLSYHRPTHHRRQSVPSGTLRPSGASRRADDRHRRLGKRECGARPHQGSSCDCYDGFRESFCYFGHGQISRPGRGREPEVAATRRPRTPLGKQYPPVSGRPTYRRSRTLPCAPRLPNCTHSPDLAETPVARPLVGHVLHFDGVGAGARAGSVGLDEVDSGPISRVRHLAVLFCRALVVVEGQFISVFNRVTCCE